MGSHVLPTQHVSPERTPTVWLPAHLLTLRLGGSSRGPLLGSHGGLLLSGLLRRLLLSRYLRCLLLLGLHRGCLLLLLLLS